MNKYYDIDYTKQKLEEYLKKGFEVELCIRINGNDYMIITLKNKISFQWIGNSSEIYYSSVSELFSSNLINQIVLNNDWNKIEDIWFY